MTYEDGTVDYFCNPGKNSWLNDDHVFVLSGGVGILNYQVNDYFVRRDVLLLRIILPVLGKLRNPVLTSLERRNRRLAAVYGYKARRV